jgi:LysR family hydrogen peroxide-inducible transcriptional activator
MHPAIEATSLHTLIQMVDGGVGIALLPEMTLKSGILRGTRLVARPFSTNVPSRTIALVTRPTSAREEDFELLARFIEDSMRGVSRPRTASRASTRKP